MDPENVPAVDGAIDREIKQLQKKLGIQRSSYKGNVSKRLILDDLRTMERARRDSASPADMEQGKSA
ncbi:MAG: hypothetical protein KAY37_04570 [Phycisphaerae bacterium]|nr:hypothetical protein [Phycisphaerae bacterium]